MYIRRKVAFKLAPITPQTKHFTLTLKNKNNQSRKKCKQWTYKAD